MHFLSDRTKESSIFAFSLRELLAEDSDVWLYEDLFDTLNLEEFDWAYSNEGQHPIDPKLMLRTIFYGLTHGVVSGRKLESVCRNDLRYRILCGDLQPVRRTFDKFINRHRQRIEDLFVKSVQLAMQMNLVKLGRVAIDGTRLKGNTSKHRSMNYEKMTRAIEYIKQELAELSKSLSDENATEHTVDDKLSKDIVDRVKRRENLEKAKAQIEREFDNRVRKGSEETIEKAKNKSRKSLADVEAMALDHKSGNFVFGYNGQAVVDSENQIIVAADLHDKATDYEALPQLLKDVEQICGSSAKLVLADLGYKSIENIKMIESTGAQAYIAFGSKEKNETEVQGFEQLHFTGVRGKYQCLSEKPLPIHGLRKDGRTEFKVPSPECMNCEMSAACKLFGKKTFSIPREEDRQILMRHLKKSRTAEFKDIYRHRKAIVEPVFGNIKSNKNLKINVRGKTKVRTWWKMACTAHNIEKIVRAMR